MKGFGMLILFRTFAKELLLRTTYEEIYHSFTALFTARNGGTESRGSQPVLG
jgi:hypothetical protein